MEINYLDVSAKTRCVNREERIVNLVHEYLGLASVVSVETISEKNALRLETASGSFLAEHDLSKVRY